DGLIHVTRDGGENWANVTPAAMPEWAMINSIDVDPFNEGGAYVAATRYKKDDFKPYLYHTTDWGKSWKQISDGIPVDQFTRVLRADPDREGLLYAGTERGLYVSSDNGQSWRSLQLNLPIVPITDLQVKAGDLVAATQGRGFWILDDLSVLHQGVETRGIVRLYNPRDAYRYIAGGYTDDPKNAGTNSQPGVYLYYFLPEDVAADDLSISVFDAAGEDAIWTWTGKPESDEEESTNDEVDTRVLSTSAGLNRHIWNLEYPGMERFDGLIMWADMKSGPRAVPGQYRAELIVGESTYETNFTVVADPRATATKDDYAAQFAFVTEARDLLSRTHREIERIRTLRTQLDALKARLIEAGDNEESPSALLAEIIATDESMTAIEEALYQTKNESRQDPLNFPIRLNNKLTSLMRGVASDDVGPTAAAQAVKTELTEAIEVQLVLLDSVWTQRVPTLNAMVRESGLEMLVLESE
ncbi:MAG: glycosyl hydrolase, partial [Pseudomonadota bacterium]